jgi:hypothetical protein
MTGLVMTVGRRIGLHLQGVRVRGQPPRSFNPTAKPNHDFPSNLTSTPRRQISFTSRRHLTLTFPRRAPPSATPKPQNTASATTTPTSSPIPVAATIPPLPLWQRLGPLTRFFRFFARSQRLYPLRTQLISTLVVYLLGDLCAQRLRASDGEAYDGARTAKALVIGAGSSIPTYKWFLYLGTCFNYLPTLPSLAAKVLVNQVLYTPIFNSYFFGMQALLSLHHDITTWAGWAGIADHIYRTVPTSFVNSCKLWPAVTAFSFTFVLPEYRNIFAGVIAIGWQTYLSFLNRKAERAEELEEGATLHLLHAEAGGKGVAGAKT